MSDPDIIDTLPDPLFIDDLAKALRCSRSTIEKQRREHGNLPPEMPTIDKRPRWDKATVRAWKAQTQSGQRFRVAQERRFKGGR